MNSPRFGCVFQLSRTLDFENFSSGQTMVGPPILYQISYLPYERNYFVRRAWWELPLSLNNVQAPTQSVWTGRSSASFLWVKSVWNRTIFKQIRGSKLKISPVGASHGCASLVSHYIYFQYENQWTLLNTISNASIYLIDIRWIVRYLLLQNLWKRKRFKPNEIH